MENSIRLQSSIYIYDVEFDEVQYEVQVTDGVISAMYRSDGFNISGVEGEDLRDFIYNNK